MAGPPVGQGQEHLSPNETTARPVLRSASPSSPLLPERALGRRSKHGAPGSSPDRRGAHRSVVGIFATEPPYCASSVPCNRKGRSPGAFESRPLRHRAPAFEQGLFGSVRYWASRCRAPGAGFLHDTVDVFGGFTGLGGACPEVPERGAAHCLAELEEQLQWTGGAARWLDLDALGPDDDSLLPMDGGAPQRVARRGMVDPDPWEAPRRAVGAPNDSCGQLEVPAVCSDSHVHDSCGVLPLAWGGESERELVECTRRALGAIDRRPGRRRRPWREGVGAKLRSPRLAPGGEEQTGEEQRATAGIHRSSPMMVSSMKTPGTLRYWILLR